MGGKNSPESINRYMAKAYDSPCGYILSTGCDIPIGTTLENMDIMMEAFRYYGKMPVNTDLFLK